MIWNSQVSSTNLSIAQLVERMTVVVSSCYHQVAGSIPARETFLEELYIFASMAKVNK
jgi:hypothetical protein